MEIELNNQLNNQIVSLQQLKYIFEENNQFIESDDIVGFDSIVLKNQLNLTKVASQNSDLSFGNICEKHLTQDYNMDMSSESNSLSYNLLCEQIIDYQNQKQLSDSLINDSLTQNTLSNESLSIITFADNNHNIFQSNLSASQFSQSLCSIGRQSVENSSSCIQETEIQRERKCSIDDKKLKQVDFEVIHLNTNLIQNKKYFIYGEIFVDLDSIFEEQNLESIGFNSYKKVNNVKQIHDNGYIEITFDTIEKPLKEFKFLVDQIKNMPYKKALELSQLLEQYYVFVQKQIIEEDTIKNLYSQSLLHKRNEFCQQKSDKIISMLDENLTVLYSQFKMNPDTLQLQTFKQGVSRKLAWIQGCTLEDLGMMYLHNGELDFIKCSNKIEMAMQKVLVNFSDMQREKYMRQNNQTTQSNTGDVASQKMVYADMITVDGLTIPVNIVESKINLSIEFDQQNGITGLLPEYLMVCEFQIDINQMLTLIQHRCKTSTDNDSNAKLNIQETNKIHNIDDYYNKSKNFIDKFYPKDEQDGKQIIKPKFKKYTSNTGQLLKSKNRSNEDKLNEIINYLSNVNQIK